MQDVLGFTFREKMMGPVALGQTDYQAGAQAGRAAGTALTLHATIEIADLNRFIADPDHPGSITGSIDYPPLGLALPSTKGVFNLFSPTNDPDMKYMVYEMGFDAVGKSYYLAGHKDVAKASIVHLWSATTTLYTQLHEGVDASGAVIGAGILTLDLADLLAMIPTMHAVNAKSAAEAAEATTRFGRFFLGELWETYVKQARV
jgi:cholesterol oxidase